MLLAGCCAQYAEAATLIRFRNFHSIAARRWTTRGSLARENPAPRRQPESALCQPLLRTNLLASHFSTSSVSLSAAQALRRDDMAQTGEAVRGIADSPDKAAGPRKALTDLPVSDTFTKKLPGDEIGNRYDHDQWVRRSRLRVSQLISPKPAQAPVAPSPQSIFHACQTNCNSQTRSCLSFSSRPRRPWSAIKR